MRNRRRSPSRARHVQKVDCAVQSAMPNMAVSAPELLTTSAHILKDGPPGLHKSLRAYTGCVGTLLLLVGILVQTRPKSPPGGVCTSLAPSLLLPPPAGSLSTASVQALWECTKAYQEANWWFVLAFFEVMYVGIKMLAVPATFTLCILAGALFPMPLCQVVTGFGEAVGSSLCYMLSQAFLSPIVEHFFASKLASMRQKAHEERRHMLSFNFFLRLTPFMPNWLINLSCPLVGVPLRPFFIGSLFGTQASLLFLALSGATLRAAGETGFDLGKIQRQLKLMAGLMLVLQLVPIAFIYAQKRAAQRINSR